MAYYDQSKAGVGNSFQRSRSVQKAEEDGWHVDLEVLPRPCYRITWLEVYSVLQDHRWSHYSDCTKPDFGITRKLFNTKSLACQPCLSCQLWDKRIRFISTQDWLLQNCLKSGLLLIFLLFAPPKNTGTIFQILFEINQDSYWLSLWFLI